MSSPAIDFHQLFDAAPDAMVVVDRHGLVTALNLEAERIFGWTEHHLVGEPMSQFVPERFHLLLDSDAASTVPGGTVRCFARRRDGTECPAELARRPLGTGDDGQSLLTLRDLTKWRRAFQNRSWTDEQARATLESIGDAVITTDMAGIVTYLNPVAEHLTGWDPEQAVGQSLDTILPLVSEATRTPIPNAAVRCLEEGRSIDLEDGVLLLRQDGTEVPIGDSAAPLRDRNGSKVGVVLVIQNEREKRRVSRRLSYEATHDGLTGLINRREFERRLTRVVKELASGAEHGLICLDLDRFKRVNDAGGHDAGDALLRRLSGLLTRKMRKRDTVARLGGDEFGILLEHCPPVEAERIAEGVRSAVEQFGFEWGAGTPFAVSASIGLVSITRDTGSVAAVFRAADTACYLAKETGGNRVALHRSSIPGL